MLDGHPATLAWLGAVHGHRMRPLGVEHFGQTGTIADLYRHYGIDANARRRGGSDAHARPPDPAFESAAVSATPYKIASTSAGTSAQPVATAA